MSLGDDLAVILSSYHGGYRLMRRRMMGDTRPVLPTRFRNVSYATLAVTLSRLKKKGLVRNERGVWYLTQQGLARVRNLSPFAKRFRSDTPGRKQEKRMIVMFDVPEKKRKARDWLRFALADLGFTLLQKSVWFGPTPLPKEFVVALKDTQLLQYVKFFKATESDVI